MIRTPPSVVFVLSVVILIITAVSEPLLAGDIVGTARFPEMPPRTKQSLSPFARPRVRSGVAGPDQQQLTPSAESLVLAVVYLEDDPRLDDKTPPRTNPVMGQRNITIIPNVLPVVLGTTVDFPNSDYVYHNLFSLSPARRFDLGRYSFGKTKSIRFDRPGEVKIFCDIHPSMKGIILVLPNNYFQSIGADGAFRIKDVPGGEYRLHLWHEVHNELIRIVEVPEEGTIEVEFSFPGE